jgi:hypothetical protein
MSEGEGSEIYWRGKTRGNAETVEKGEIVIGPSLENYIPKNLKSYNIRLSSFRARLCGVSKLTP